MASRKTYEIGDNYIALLDAAEKLDSWAESDEDCLGALCSLSGVGEWGIDKNGRRVYRAALDENECQGLTETGVQPVGDLRRWRSCNSDTSRPPFRAGREGCVRLRGPLSAG